MLRRSSFPVVLLCFVLSGFAALVYETVWLRQFSVVFGTSEYAVATVLAGYMGGLALGGAVAPAIARRVRSQVRTYAFFELGIAVSAVLWVPNGMRLVRSLKVSLFGNQPEPLDAGQFSGLLFDQVTSFGIIMVPTVLMGATLPLLARHVIDSNDNLGRRIGMLYSCNTLGAVLGTLVAAFGLLPALGLQMTVYCGAAVNLLVFLLAASLPSASTATPASETSDERSTKTGETTEETSSAAEGDGPAAAGPRAAESSVVTERRPLTGLSRWILPLILISGGTSFAYEILWTRMLGHVLGASVFAFATMLASFLLGITVGSMIAARFARTRQQAIYGFIFAQLSAALCSRLVFSGLTVIPELARQLSEGMHGDVAPGFLLSVVVLLPAATSLGATFPFAVRIVADSEDQAEAAAGSVLAWNTVGAIFGALATSMFLLPSMNYEQTAALLIGLNAVLALLTLSACGGAARRSRIAWVAATSTAVVVIAFPPHRPDAILRASSFSQFERSGEIVHYAAGRSSTVVMIRNNDSHEIMTNGLPEAMILPSGSPPEYAGTQPWLCALPVLLKPDLQSMLVIGFGGGNALASVAPGVATVDVFELEPEVLQANRLVGNSRAGDPLADPRIRVILNDARNGLMLTSKQYDAIVSQPSHPWTAGASHLYTLEFLREAERHLREGGVFVQWMNEELLDDELFRSLGATMLTVFDEVLVFQPNDSGLLFVGSSEPLQLQSLFASPRNADGPLADFFSTLGVHSVNDVCFLLALDDSGLTELCQGAPPVTDDRNRLAWQTPALSAAGTVSAVDPLLAEHDPVTDTVRRKQLPLAGQLNLPYLVRRFFNAGFEERAQRLAASIPSSGERALAQAWLLLLRGDYGRAREALANSTVASARAAEVCYAKFLLNQLSGGDPSLPAECTSDSLPRSLSAVIQGSQFMQNGQWEELSKLDSLLAAARPVEGWFLPASQFRVFWRLSLNDPGRNPHELAREAVHIADQVIPLRPVLNLMNLRVHAAVLSGDHDLALASMSAAVRYMGVLESRQSDDELAQRIVQTHAGDVRQFVQSMNLLESRLPPGDSSHRNRLLRIRQALQRQLQLVPSQSPRQDDPGF